MVSRPNKQWLKELQGIKIMALKSLVLQRVHAINLVIGHRRFLSATEFVDKMRTASNISAMVDDDGNSNLMDLLFTQGEQERISLSISLEEIYMSLEGNRETKLFYVSHADPRDANVEGYRNFLHNFNFKVVSNEL